MIAGILFDSMQRIVKEAITENLGLKFLALLVALLLFVLVRYQEQAERLVDAEIVPPSMEKSSGLVITGEIPDSVKVRVRGPKSWIDKADKIRPLQMVLASEREGTTYYHFNPEDFEVESSGFKVVKVTPESVPIKIERLLSRRVPVRIRLTGKLKNGAEFADEPTAEPNELYVVGAASILRTLKSIETEDVDVENLDAGQHERIVPVKRLEDVDIRGADEIKVGLQIRWIPGQRTFSGLIVQVDGTELSSEVLPREVAVAVTGPQVALDRLELEKVVPKITLSSRDPLKPGTYPAIISVEGLPEEIKVTSIIPAKVQIRLTATPGSRPRNPSSAP